MTQPNPALLEQYQNHWCLEKTAAPPLLKMLSGLLGAGAIMGDQQHVENHRQEAARMNLVSRKLEARKMDATTSNFGGPSGPSPGGPGDFAMDKYEAQAMDEALFKGSSALATISGAALAARSIEQGMAKEALLGAMAGKAMGALKKSKGALGKLKAGPAAGKVTGRAPSPSGALKSPEMLRKEIESGHKLEQNIRQTAGLPPQPVATGSIAGGPKKSLPTPGKAPPATTGRAAPPARRAKPPPPPSGKPAPGKGKPLVSTGTKAKILGAGALGVAGYAGYKGLSATRDYMNTPGGNGTWGSGPRMMNNVNQYGTATY